MHSNEFLDDPAHFRIFVPDKRDLQNKLLRVYHDSPIGMHRGRDASYHMPLARFLLERDGKGNKTQDV